MPLPLIPLAVELVALASTGIAAWMGFDSYKKEQQMKEAGLIPDDGKGTMKKVFAYVGIAGVLFALYKFIKLFKR